MSKRKRIAEPAAYVPKLIDAHTHLTSCKDEPADIVARAAAAGVERICTVGDGLAEAQAALELAQQFPQVYAACAIHPTRANELDDAAKTALTQMAQDPKCVAIGETGLDTYWITHDPENTAALAVQEEALAWHAELARSVRKPLMIHNREADAELMQCLDSAAASDVTVMLHCFSSPLDVAKEAIERGYVLSFAGNVTFKRNDELREAAKLVPLEQLFIETDAPYMTPEPFRGARNEPAIIGHTAACIAEARGMSVEALAEALFVNFHKIYQVELDN